MSIFDDIHQIRTLLEAGNGLKTDFDDTHAMRLTQVAILDQLLQTSQGVLATSLKALIDGQSAAADQLKAIETTMTAMVAAVQAAAADIHTGLADVNKIVDLLNPPVVGIMAEPGTPTTH